jgi:hypothetical protein
VNNKLEKIIKLFNYSSLINVECSRGNFTRHGLHLSVTGKETVSRKIAPHINSFFQQKGEVPIWVAWKSALVVCAIGVNKVMQNDPSVSVCHNILVDDSSSLNYSSNMKKKRVLRINQIQKQ